MNKICEYGPISYTDKTYLIREKITRYYKTTF